LLGSIESIYIIISGETLFRRLSVVIDHVFELIKDVFIGLDAGPEAWHHLKLGYVFCV
jgi:hypothetical protein